MTALYIILGMLAVLILGPFFVYNALVRLRMRAQEAWADIEVQMKRRYDLIPNVVETVKGYAGHERETLESVTAARVVAMGAATAKEHEQAENMLSSTLKTLFAVSESYPDLKANANFLDLQRELADTENKIQAARRFYNANVRDLNMTVESFPQGIIARMFNFEKMDFFELTDGDSAARDPVKVSF